MYDLPHFKEHDRDVLIKFVKDHPLAFITGVAEDGFPIATQIPVFLEENEKGIFLTGHMMKHSPHHKAFAVNSKVLTVFTGSNTYVSATWYTNPHQASTWNYMSIHMKGLISFMDDEGLIEMLRKTTLHFEGQNKDAETIFDNLPEQYRSNLMKGIVAFEIKVEDIQNVFKLSQNRDQESYRNIIKKLEEKGGEAAVIAGEMKVREENLYNKK